MKLAINGAYGYLVKYTKDEEFALWRAFTVKGTKYIPKLRKVPEYKFYHLKSRRVGAGLVPLIPFFLDNVDICDVADVDTLPQTTIGDMTLRDYQLEAIRSMMGQKRGIIEVGTGGGKTVIMAGAHCVFPTPAAIVVHSKEIFNQLIEEFTEWGFNPGFVASGKGLELGDELTVCMVQTLKSRLLSEDSIWKWWNEDLRTVFVDEAHHCKSNSYKECLSQCAADYRFGFSATIPNIQHIDYWRTTQFLGPVIHKVSLGKLAKDGYVTPVKVLRYKYKHENLKWIYAEAIRDAAESMVKCQICNGDGCTNCNHTGKHKLGPVFENGRFTSDTAKTTLMRVYYEKIVTYQVSENAERNSIVASEALQGNGVLCIVSRKKHGQNLLQAISDAEYIDGDSSERKEALDRLKSGKLRCLIATNIVDEGIDIAGIRKVILCGVGKSQRQVIQRIGRGVRKDKDKHTLTVVDINDVGQKWLENHAKQRGKIYKEQGFEVTEIK